MRDWKLYTFKRAESFLINCYRCLLSYLIETNRLSMDRWLKIGGLKKICHNSLVPFTNAEQIELLIDNGFIESSDNSPVNSNNTVQAIDSKHLSSKRGVKRKYDESYLGFGFTWTSSGGCPDALCVICQTIQQNSSLAPAKMRRHFERNHPTLVGKSISFFDPNFVLRPNQISFLF